MAQSCRAQGRSPRTIITYEDAVEKLRAWRNVNPPSGEGLETLTKLEARAFVRMLLDTYTPGEPGYSVYPALISGSRRQPTSGWRASYAYAVETANTAA